MGRPRLHDERTERQLLRAAEALLAAEGAEGLSVRRLAEAAGASPRAIYSLFGSKDGLVRALFREAFHALSEDLDALPVTGDPARDLVEAGVTGFRGWALSHPELFRLVFEGGGPDVQPAPADSQVGAAAFGRLLVRVRRCADAGLIAEADAPTLGVAFHAMCEGLASVELRSRLPLWNERTPAEVWRESLGALVRGFASPVP